MKGKFLTLIGTALTLALSSNMAIAQSSKFPELQKENKEEATPSADRELPPDVMEILCKNFPLNSRCQGGTASTPPVTPITPDAAPRPENIETPINPTEVTPDSGSEIPSAPETNETPNNPTNLEQTPLITPDSTSPSGTTDSPLDGLTSPENTPSEPTPSNLTPSNPDGVNNDSSETETKIEVPGTTIPENNPINESQPDNPSTPGAEQLQLPESSTPEQPSSPSGM